MLGLAMDQRWLGLTATPLTESGLASVESVDPEGPSRALAPSSVLVAITGRDGRRIAIGPEDLVEEPDTLPTYEAMRAFFARQDAIAGALGMKPVEIETEFLSVQRRNEVRPASRRPATSLPPDFWMQ